MIKLHDVHPVHMTEEQINRMSEILQDWGPDSKVLSLNTWDKDRKPHNVSVMDMKKLLSMEDMDTRIPYPNESFDNVICIDTLTYISDPFKFIEEIYRVLRPGGSVYIESSFLQPMDSGNQDYFRFTPKGMKFLLEDFEFEDLGIVNGPGSTMHWIGRIYHSLQFDRAGTMEDMLTKLADGDYVEAYRIFGMMMERYLETDEELNEKEHAISIACSFYVMATKPVELGGAEGVEEYTESRI